MQASLSSSRLVLLTGAGLCTTGVLIGLTLFEHISPCGVLLVVSASLMTVVLRTRFVLESWICMLGRTLCVMLHLSGPRWCSMCLMLVGLHSGVSGVRFRCVCWWPWCLALVMLSCVVLLSTIVSSL